MLTDDDVRTFHENGFVTVTEPVLSPDQLTELRDALQRVIEGKSAAQPETKRNIGKDDRENVVIQIVNIWEAEPAFRDHLYNASIVPMIARLMDAETVRVWHDQVQIKPAQHGGSTTWHQDFPYWPVLEPAELVSAWVALEDATIENGCMSMVRRSHRWGAYHGGTIGNTATHDPAYDPAFLPPGEKVEVVPVEVPAGCVAFHHCLTWHGAPPNRSERPRPAIAVHYMPGHTRYVPKREHLVERHIHVAPGEILVGDHFPTVYEHGTRV